MKQNESVKSLKASNTARKAYSAPKFEQMDFHSVVQGGMSSGTEGVGRTSVPGRV